MSCTLCHPHGVIDGRREIANHEHWHRASNKIDPNRPQYDGVYYLDAMDRDVIRRNIQKHSTVHSSATKSTNKDSAFVHKAVPALPPRGKEDARLPDYIRDSINIAGWRDASLVITRTRSKIDPGSTTNAHRLTCINSTPNGLTTKSKDATKDKANRLRVKEALAPFAGQQVSLTFADASVTGSEAASARAGGCFGRRVLEVDPDVDYLSSCANTDHFSKFFLGNGKCSFSGERCTLIEWLKEEVVHQRTRVAYHLPPLPVLAFTDSLSTLEEAAKGPLRQTNYVAEELWLLLMDLLALTSVTLGFVFSHTADAVDSYHEQVDGGAKEAATNEKTEKRVHPLDSFDLFNIEAAPVRRQSLRDLANPAIAGCRANFSQELSKVRLIPGLPRRAYRIFSQVSTGSCYQIGGYINNSKSKQIPPPPADPCRQCGAAVLEYGTPLQEHLLACPADAPTALREKLVEKKKWGSCFQYLSLDTFEYLSLFVREDRSFGAPFAFSSQ